MVGRLWHGWTNRGNAEGYQELLRTKLPGIQGVEGRKGAYVLRRDIGDEVEFVVLTLFESMDAVRAFAGEDYERAVLLPGARELLSRFDERSRHYEVVVQPA